MAFYLGLDAGTQSLSAVLVEIDGPRRAIIAERGLPYDEALPRYQTTRGVRRAANGVVVSPPLMWVEALEVAIANLAREWPAEMSRLAALSGAAQQHGSVYVNRGFTPALEALDPERSMAAQLAHGLARPVAPVWMDTSTRLECREIEAAVGGPEALAARTGSRAFERFTAAQIRRVFTHEPEAYASTTRIHLVSSWLASALTGLDAPLDPGDASGMNLMDLARRAWWPAALDATAPGLAAKLPSLVAATAVVGPLSPYWRERFRLPPARVVVWTGDNPSSLIGTGLVREGRLAASLGTSDTVFGLMGEPHVSPDGTGHVFSAPTGDFMGMTVFQNGSLARERVRDAYGLDWAAFEAALRATPAGNGGAMMLPWFESEITPRVECAGVRRANLDPADASGSVRAVVEGQMLAMAEYSRWMGVEVRELRATGGASRSREILQVMADVFGADVYLGATGNSAALGAAIRAYHADRLASGTPVDWDDAVAGLADPAPSSRVAPIEAHVAAYNALRPRMNRWRQEERAL